MTHEDALELIKAIHSLDSSIMSYFILFSIALILFGRR